MKRYVLVVAVAAALGLACDSKATMPAPVNSSSASALDLNADGSNLKVSAPAPTSPVNDFVVDASPTLVATASTGKYGTPALQYEFEVFNDANVRVQVGTASTPSFKTSVDIAVFDKRFTWRVRAVIPAENSTGPWSSSASFKTPLGGYNRNGELFDPLTNGKSIGISSGVTFLANGVRLDTKDSYVEWTMPTVAEGEFSAIMTNIGNGSEEWKTKVMSMLQGDGVNTTDNQYRVTVDKRTGWLGQGSPARFTFCTRTATNLAGVCPEPNAGPQSWNRSINYFWQLTWRANVVRLIIRSGGVNGAIMVDLASTYNRPYVPSPHVIRLGSVGGRADNETNPGTIVRNVWVSNRPRPLFPGDQ